MRILKPFMLLAVIGVLYSNGHVLDLEKNIIGYYANGYIYDTRHEVIGNYVNGYIKNLKLK